jgi:hypothetical protein
VAEGVRFVFGFAVTSERVVEEYLVAYPKGVPQRWYERRYDAAKDAYEWSRPSTAFQQDRSLQSKTRPNSLFLSVGAQFNHAQLTRVYEWFAKGLRFIHFGLEDVFNLDLTKELIAQAKQRDRILGLVCHADLGVADAQIREREAVLGDFLDLYLGTFGMGPDVQRQAKPSTRLEVSLTHQADGVDPVALDFEKEESAGTRRFFSLVGPWMEVLDRGHTVFVDEIETSLHPNLVKELLRLFLGNEGNPKGAQVVFTTHNPLLLDGTLMRRDQVWFTEKSSAGATHLYPLTDYQPRKDEALAKGYLAGRYGAIPFMPEGLKL